MLPNRVYLLHPSPQYLPDVAGWIEEVQALLPDLSEWAGWELHCSPYNDKNGFEVAPLHVRVLNKRGPIVFLEKVQSKLLANIRQKLGTEAVILIETVSDSTGLWSVVDEARRRHEAGEPLLARKLVVAVLIVRKLRRGNFWSGNAKGYLWHYDLAKGRGVDERFADIVEEVANDLLLHAILVSKTSQGKQKYALNPFRKSEIHAIADDGIFQNERLLKIFLKDKKQEPGSYLHLPHTAQKFTVRSGETPRFECTTAKDAISHVKKAEEVTRYEASVLYENGKTLSEVFVEKRVILQFFEVFL